MWQTKEPKNKLNNLGIVQFGHWSCLHPNKQTGSRVTRISQHMADVLEEVRSQLS